MKKLFALTPIILCAIFFTSCTNPMDYEDVQKAKSEAAGNKKELKINSNHEELAIVVGKAEKLTRLETAISGGAVTARIPVIVPGSKDTIFAGLFEAGNGNFMNEGDTITVRKTPIHQVNQVLKPIPLLTEAVITGKEENRIFGGHDIVLSVGNGSIPIIIRAQDEHFSKVPAHMLAKGDHVMLKEYKRIDSKIES
jgi:hypothetical protein